MSAFAIILLSETMFGGAQKRFLNLYVHFRKKYGHRVWFIVTPKMKYEMSQSMDPAELDGIYALGEFKPAEHRKSKEVPGNKSNIRRLITKSGLLSIYFYFKSKKRAYKDFLKINEFAEEKGIDRFLAVYTGVLPLYFYFNKKDRNKRIVFSNMDSWFSHFEENKIKRILNQYVLFHRAHEESNHIDFLSPFILNEIRRRNFIPANQNYSITKCSFIDYSKCFVGDKSDFSFVFSGRLEEDKNPILFLEASLKLADKHPDVTFYILGKGRLSEKINSMIEKSKSKNVICLGFVVNPCERFAKSSVFVSLQKENNYPSQSVLEAMACGNAIIATDVGDTRLFVNDQNGFLIQASLKELISVMEKCIHKKTEVLSLGMYAERYVKEHFSIDVAADYYYSLLYPEINDK